MKLLTERLILRPWKLTDAEYLYQYAKEPEVGATAGWKAHPDISYSRQIIEKDYSASEVYAVCRKEDDHPIGCFSLKFNGDTELTDQEDECEISAWIGRKFWNMGYISEAGRELLRHGFEELGLNVIWAAYYDGNEKSGHVLEKYGLAYDHTIKNLYIPIMNELRNVHVMGISRKKWEEQSQKP